MLPDEYNEGHGHWLPTATCTGLGRCLWGRTSARVRSTLDPREAKQSARRIAPRISCERVFSRALGRLRARRGHGTGKGRRARRGVRLRRDARRRAQRAGEGGGRQQRSTLGDRRERASAGTCVQGETRQPGGGTGGGRCCRRGRVVAHQAPWRRPGGHGAGPGAACACFEAGGGRAGGRGTG
jgi:hypothetical protein